MDSELPNRLWLIINDLIRAYSQAKQVAAQIDPQDVVKYNAAHKTLAYREDQLLETFLAFYPYLRPQTAPRKRTPRPRATSPGAKVRPASPIIGSSTSALDLAPTIERLRATSPRELPVSPIRLKTSNLDQAQAQDLPPPPSDTNSALGARTPDDPTFPVSETPGTGDLPTAEKTRGGFVPDIQTDRPPSEIRAPRRDAIPGNRLWRNPARKAVPAPRASSPAIPAPT